MLDPVSNIRRISILKPKYVIIISIVIVVVMVFSSVYEYNKSKNEIFDILEEYSNSMIQTASMSSANSIISDREMESLLTQHLLSTAKNTAHMDSLGRLSNEALIRLAHENDVFRINVFDKNGQRIMTNNVGDIHAKENPKYSPVDYIDPILNGTKSEIIIGLKEARMEKGNRYAVAVRRPFNRGAIVVNLDAESYMNFRNKIGFGKLILDIGSATGIEYIILQNPTEILAANKNVNELPTYENDPQLKSVFETGNSLHRVIRFGGNEIYEAVSLFSIENEKIGLFRIGLGMDGIIAAQARMLRRAVVTTLVVIVIMIIVLSVVISNQNYRIISDEFRKIKTFTGSVLENMSLAIITVDDKGRIKIFNKSAFEIFGIPYSDYENRNIGTIEKLPGFVKDILKEKKHVKNLEADYTINTARRSFLINSAIVNNDDRSTDTYSLVIEDITEAKEIENQLAQNERLAAMGGLASGVAHEIRNPLNTINMIAQRMNREYSGKLSSVDFDSLVEILRSESKRVNGIIEQFLTFAKPAKLNRTEFKISDFLDEVVRIADVQTREKGITLILNNPESGIINADYQQMKQVFINLLRNSIEATETGGTIELSYRCEKRKHLFEVKDTGVGIAPDTLNKIFDIYFTTKSGGTGMGLSIVRQIILQHNGSINAESELNKGTKFSITLP